ncbi:MAG: response regulator [Bacteroidetes bacterium]|nr:response regulator [Bacteroidota bacterium]MBU1372449.1 response regulator [Bacteroidota bacterium]MBU1483473.1 response regulator [Bacteroidota bacterium]MBU1761374.1 response regulator [Bacteroidota bacterium]MBU2046737.1 response regulator [Bacteroidota bacterium]
MEREYSTVSVHKKSIWIADDDPDDRLIIKEAFEENHYNNPISFFEDGEKVLIKFKENSNLNDFDFPSLLILDLNMPKVNGLELLTLLKKNEKTKHIPVIILTTSKSKSDKQKLIDIGADDYITKPYSFDSMIEITKNLIEKYG